MRSLLIGFLLVPWLLAGIIRAAELDAQNDVLPPWAKANWTIESGILWEVGSGTPWPYRLVEGQLVWRSRRALGVDLANGSHIVVRHRLALIGALMQQGPESHYVAFSGSPSLEWWNAAGTTALFGGAGGGFGLVDSQGVRGGQGQDFTLNWFMRGGIEHVTKSGRNVSAAIMFQHMSNGGATEPNPGIDALGFMLGWTW